MTAFPCLEGGLCMSEKACSCLYTEHAIVAYWSNLIVFIFKKSLALADDFFKISLKCFFVFSMVANYSELILFLKLLPRTPRLWHLKFSFHQVRRKEGQGGGGLQQKLRAEWKIWVKCCLAVTASSAWSASGTLSLGSPECLLVANSLSSNWGSDEETYRDEVTLPGSWHQRTTGSIESQGSLLSGAPSVAFPCSELHFLEEAVSSAWKWFCSFQGCQGRTGSRMWIELDSESPTQDLCRKGCLKLKAEKQPPHLCFLVRGIPLSSLTSSWKRPPRALLLDSFTSPRSLVQRVTKQRQKTLSLRKSKINSPQAFVCCLT